MRWNQHSGPCRHNCAAERSTFTGRLATPTPAGAHCRQRPIPRTAAAREPPILRVLGGDFPREPELERCDAPRPPNGRRQRAPRRFASLPPRPGEHITRPNGEPRRRSPHGAPAPARDTVQTRGDGAGRGSPSAKTRQAASKQTRVGPRPGAGPGRKRKSPSRGFSASIGPAVSRRSRQFMAKAGSSWREPAPRVSVRMVRVRELTKGRVDVQEPRHAGHHRDIRARTARVDSSPCSLTDGARPPSARRPRYRSGSSSNYDFDLRSRKGVPNRLPNPEAFRGVRLGEETEPQALLPLGDTRLPCARRATSEPSLTGPVLP